MKQSFWGHSSVNRIKQNSSIQRFPCGHEISVTTPTDLLKLLKRSRYQKACRL